MVKSKSKGGGKKKQEPKGGRDGLDNGDARARRMMASVCLLVVLLAVCAVIPFRETGVVVDAEPSNDDGAVCAQGGDRDGNCEEAPKTENDVSEEKLEGLLTEAMAAYQAQKFAKVNALCDRISRLALTNWSWDRMRFVHHLNGMALVQLGEGIRALWCFKCAMYLTDKQQKISATEELTQFAQGVGNSVMGAGKNFYVAASTALQGGRGDADLLYTAAQYAQVVGKLEEAKKMIGVLTQLQPDHAGAIVLRGVIAKHENQGGQALQLLREASRREQLPHDASTLWTTLAEMECDLDQTSDTCATSWQRAFEAEIELTPMNRDIATIAAVNACNVKLKTVVGGNVDIDSMMKQVKTIGQKATDLGLLNAPLQLPQKLIRGVTFAPFRDDASTWKAVRYLEDNFEAIRDEIVEADAAGKLRRMAALDHEGLHTAGEWRELNILAHGHVNKNAIDMLPITSKIVFGLRDGVSMVLGGTKISLMQPGTVVRPHTGQTNARARIHLGVSIPSGPRLRVGNETRSWTEGKCTVIDDSYVHEVWHDGDERRIVLIVDVWHPEMDGGQRLGSASESFPQLETYRKMSADPAAELRRQGVPGNLIPSSFIGDAWYMDDDTGNYKRSIAGQGEL